MKQEQQKEHSNVTFRKFVGTLSSAISKRQRFISLNDHEQIPTFVTVTNLITLVTAAIMKLEKKKKGDNSKSIFQLRNL